MTPFSGALLIIASNALFSLSHSSIRWLSGSYSLTFLMFIRFISGPLFLVPYFIYKGYKPTFNHWYLILIRTFFGFLSMGFYFYSFKYIGLGKATLIYNFSIVWTLIMAMLVFGDRPSWQTKAAIPVALCGLYLVLRPEHLVMISFGEVLALIGSFFNAGVVISLKALRKHHDAFFIVMVNYTLSSLILFYPALHAPLAMPTKWQIVAMIVSGVVGLLGQLFMTFGYRYTPASIAGSAALIGVPLMCTIGIVFFNEHSDHITFLGGGIVFCCLGVITRFQ